jgi:hypothetical protein
MLPIEQLNAFYVLELPVEASADQIVDKTRKTAPSTSPEEAQAQREARERLLINPLVRLRQELYEVPAARYQDEAWRQFCRAFKNNPVNLDSLSRGNETPTLADIDWQAFLKLVIEERIKPTSDDLLPAIEQPPFAPGNGPTPLEVPDVIFG